MSLRLLRFLPALVICAGLVGFPALRTHYSLPVALMTLGLTSVLEFIRPYRESKLAPAFTAVWLAPAALLWSINERQEGRDAPQFFTLACLAIAGIGVSWVLARSEPDDPKPPVLVVPMICTWLIAYFSARTGGSQTMEPFYSKWFFDPDLLKQAIIISRKFGHVAFYSIVCLSLMTTWRAFGLPANRARWFALGMTLLLGSCDEFRQSMVPGREGKIQDVILDLTGAFLFSFFVLQSLKRKQSTALESAPH